MATKAKTKAQTTAERKSRRAQAPSRKPAEAPAVSALELLEEDHRQVEDMFDAYDGLKGDDAGKAELAQKICLALEIHALIEEEIFYPQARKATEDDDLINESLVEHATVKHLISEIEEMDVGDELYDAKIRVLGEMVKHHIREEEEELFPELERSEIDLQAVGKQLGERKEALLAEMRV
jgi:hemerythrin superfamily protein